MTNQNTENGEDSSEKLPATFMEGGLPQLLAGPAGKAISRLLGAVVEIPAAKLEGVAQEIRDKTEARSIISKAIAKRAAEMAIDDPEVMERGLNNMLSRAYRVQKNKDAVAAIAIEDLQDRPPHAEGTEPSDDWLNRFERYAEDASSDDLRIMFGKILAGEIRKTGAISPATLRFVSELNSDTAKLIERVLPYSSMEGQTFWECMEEPLNFVEVHELERIGFWTPEKLLEMTFDDDSYIICRINNLSGFAIEGKPEEKITFKASMLSSVGKELVSIVNGTFNIQAMANIVLKKPSVTGVFYGDTRDIDNGYELHNTVEMFQSET